MVAGVDLLHFDLCVHVAMVQEVDISNFNLKRIKNIHTTYEVSHILELLDLER